MSTPRLRLRLHEYAALDAAPAEPVELADEGALDAPEGVGLPARWAGPITFEGTLTGDSRLIEAGALSWTTPMPLRFVLEDNGSHLGAVNIGRILDIQRGDDGALNASGDFDLGSEIGREAARLVRDEVMTGISVDLDAVAFEVRLSRELYEQYQELFEDPEAGDGDEAELETDDEGRVIVHRQEPDDEVMVTTSAIIRAATLVSIPAFSDARIAAVVDDAPTGEPELALVASGIPVDPPHAWFTVPEPDQPTALTITDDGQVYGHLATWNACHLADPSGKGLCVVAPKSKSGYAYFHTGVVKTAEGSLVPTGVLRFATGHASMSLNATQAAAHYDNTGLAGADIRAIDGKHGVWVSGALRPGVSAEQVRTLRASPLSGDWRYIGRDLELVGALAVNLPGFPVPRPQGLVASGALTGLVAAGVVAPAQSETAREFTSGEAAVLKRLIDRERLHTQRELAARVASARRRQRITELAAQRRAIRAALGTD